MELQTLSVTNLGVFRGTHTFDLAPVSVAGGEIKHLTVIRGHNGAGKSTLFQALALALHGRLAIGDRVGRQAYSDFLFARLHRAHDETTCTEGGVALSFVFVQSGQPLNVQVERRWQIAGRSVLEDLEVRCNGQSPDVPPAEYQNWLNDLVPPGLAPVVFFDAERMDALASPEQKGTLLGDTLRRLLGLDLVERLRSDLEYNTRQRVDLDANGLRQEVVRRQTSLDALVAQLSELQSTLELLGQEQAALETALAKEERRLMAEGGAYAARRPLIERRLADIDGEIKTAAEELHEVSAGLLPFALAPELCLSLKGRLAQEAEIHRRRIADELWQERLQQAETTLGDEDLWQGFSLSAQQRADLTHRLTHMLRETPSQYAATDQRLVHRLADSDREQLQSWIDEALGSTASRTRALSSQLRRQQAERKQLEIDRQRAPDEAVLAPIHAEIARLEEALGGTVQRHEALTREAGALQYRREEEARHVQRAADQLAAAMATERQLALVERSRLALRAYQDALLRQRLAALENALVVAFNSIARKAHLLTQARYNPEDFSVELRGILGRTLTLGDFSAGERQLYALALLRALRQVGGRQLPLVIDTPLARLDDQHRWRLLHSYFPTAGSQVILFATDAELTVDLLGRAAPYLARLYSLEYEQESKQTRVTLDGRPVPEGVILYRDKIQGVISDALEKGVQSWSTDPEHAGGSNNGTLERALLPASARRLVLVDPYDTDALYFWPGVVELEGLIGNPYLGAELRSQSRRIFDLWRDDWLANLQEAGYDSVATLDIEGPVEIVLSPTKLIPINGIAVNGNGRSSDHAA